MTIFRRQEEESLNIPLNRGRADGHAEVDETILNNSGQNVMLSNFQNDYLERDLHQMSSDVEESSKKGRTKHHRIKHTYKLKKAKVTKKHKHPTSNLPLPVISVGFPKAGTSSIFAFFQQQKFRSQHWYCCKAQIDPQRGGPFLMADCLLRYMGSNKLERNKTMLQECGHFDVYAEINGPRCDDEKGCRLEDGSMDTTSSGPRIFLPQHFNLQDLHNAAPNSTWILNTRLTSDWVESVMNWSDLQHQFANEYFAQGSIDKLPEGEDEMKAFLEDIFLNHTLYVKDFVSRHPSHALIEINITDSDAAGEVLAKSFGLDASFWTVRNQRWRITWQQSIKFFGGGWWWLMLFGTSAYMCSIIGVGMSMV